MILSFFLLGLCLALVMSRYRAFSIFVIPLCLFFALARVLPIDDLIFVTVGMIWAGYTGHLMIENNYLKIDATSYKRRIKKLEKDSQNEDMQDNSKT
jgi:hypothetical protein